MKTEFTCSVCKEHKTHEDNLSTGYGKDKDGNIICFDCCGKQDAKTLTELPLKEKFHLYLNTKEKTLSNWPGTLKISVGYIKKGRHNIAGNRYDTWFRYAGNNYHAVQYGDNTQIAHIQKTKERVIF